MARILIAAAPEPAAIVERILVGHELSTAATMSQARQILGEKTFDLILCTIDFDESKMFELLQLAKSRTEWRRIPCACARVRRQILRSALARQAVQYTCRMLGAVAFLDIAQYEVEPEHEMREAIEQLLK